MKVKGKGPASLKVRGAFSILVDLEWQEQIKSGDKGKRKQETGTDQNINDFLENANDKSHSD